tara:strand:- start:12778 stop:13077 length:300 start_codon:yes stop_codon:yes gene_type:complete
MELNKTEYIEELEFKLEELQSTFDAKNQELIQMSRELDLKVSELVHIKDTMRSTFIHKTLDNAEEVVTQAVGGIPQSSAILSLCKDIRKVKSFLNQPRQ